jgi:hypothetical protein
MRVLLKPGAAAVRGYADRLGEQHALVGRGRKQPPPAAFFHQVLVVFGRLEAQERKFEAILTAGLAMAAAAVAAELGENRRDLIGKVDQGLVAEVGHRHTGGGGDPIGTLARQRDLAVGQGSQKARLVDLNHAGRSELDRDSSG